MEIASRPRPLQYSLYKAKCRTAIISSNFINKELTSLSAKRRHALRDDPSSVGGHRLPRPRRRGHRVQSGRARRARALLLFHVDTDSHDYSFLCHNRYDRHHLLIVRGRCCSLWYQASPRHPHRRRRGRVRRARPRQRVRSSRFFIARSSYFSNGSLFPETQGRSYGRSGPRSSSGPVLCASLPHVRSAGDAHFRSSFAVPAHEPLLRPCTERLPQRGFDEIPAQRAPLSQFQYYHGHLLHFDGDLVLSHHQAGRYMHP